MRNTLPGSQLEFDGVVAGDVVHPTVSETFRIPHPCHQLLRTWRARDDVQPAIVRFGQPQPNVTVTDRSSTDAVSREIADAGDDERAKARSTTIAPIDGNGIKSADRDQPDHPPRLMSHIHLDSCTMPIDHRPTLSQPCVTLVDSYENRRMRRCWY